MKKLIKDLLPPLLLRNLKTSMMPWKGIYSSWEEASADCEGYDSDKIIQKVLESAKFVAQNPRSYERDSVIFDQVQYSWPLSTALMYTAMKFNKLNVLDFGGGLGSSFFQNRFFLEGVDDLEWNIVEQKKFSDLGKIHFEDHRLKFHESIDEARATSPINFVLLSSVLQYLPSPYQILDAVLAVAPQVILIDRLSVIEHEIDLISKQVVPREIYEASYPSRFFRKENVLSPLLKNYELISEFESFVHNEGILDRKYPYKEVGFFLIKK